MYKIWTLLHQKFKKAQRSLTGWKNRKQWRSSSTFLLIFGLIHRTTIVAILHQPGFYIVCWCIIPMILLAQIEMIWLWACICANGNDKKSSAFRGTLQYKSKYLVVCIGLESHGFWWLASTVILVGCFGIHRSRSYSYSLHRSMNSPIAQPAWGLDSTLPALQPVSGETEKEVSI